ncbi:MAG TPA: YraN family protein [Spongiibacteraceae bacterium]|jgi:putative endonuclease|nr:YraN family protein [Spongiibacteraceae bacterium]HUH39084.1 YraN family protein [Spongiibacteraceae bacterium]
MRRDDGAKPPSAGRQVEQRAVEWLAGQGLSIIATNYRSRFGEIDIVADDGRCVIFVEVRYRRASLYGGAAQSVTRAKQRRISACAADFLRRHAALSRRPCRFDVLAASDHSAAPHFEWIKSAFENV